jgi:predicted ABC-type ATPase
MNLQAAIEIFSHGTHEGLLKAWDTRGRGGWRTKSTQTVHLTKSGQYNPRRLPLHDRLIEKYEHRATQESPVVHLVAGGTASGKSYIAKQAEKNLHDPAVINTDHMRADLPEFKHVVGTDKLGLLHEESSDIRDKVLAAAANHNNNIVLDAPGSQGLADKLDALEKSGYKVIVSYIHSPVDESFAMAKHRAETTTNLADKREVPPDVLSNSHDKARGVLPRIMSPGREVLIYDRTGKGHGEPFDLIYHRSADGTTRLHDDSKLGNMANAIGEKPIPMSAFK